MRKIIVLEWISLDGVFDASLMNDFFAPFHSDERGEYIKDCILNADDYLLGRVTYEMLSGYWPNLKNNEMGVADKLNNMRKVVVSTTLGKADWNNSIIIGKKVIEEVADLKKQPGNNILVAGSGTLVKSLFEAKLVDELRLLVQPIIMGTGRRFFQENLKNGLELANSKSLPLGVLALEYKAKNA